jgi:hypothetical protein
VLRVLSLLTFAGFIVVGFAGVIIYWRARGPWGRTTAENYLLAIPVVGNDSLTSTPSNPVTANPSSPAPSGPAAIHLKPPVRRRVNDNLEPNPD